MKKEILTAAMFTDMTDEQLKEKIGLLFSAIATLQEEMKNDPEVKQLSQALKNYKTDNFLDQIKDLKKQLKAARLFATDRKISWKAEL